MPTFSGLAQTALRQGISKTFIHGYAQSFVAATHPHGNLNQNRASFGRRHNQRIGPLSSLQLQNAFHPSSSSSQAVAQHDHRRERNANAGNLDAYFEALQKKQEQAETAAAQGDEVDKEWTQFQFPKQLEWKPNASEVLADPEPTAEPAPPVEAAQDVEDGPAEDVAAEDGPTDDGPAKVDLAHVDAVLQGEIQDRKLQEALEEFSANVSTGQPLSRVPTPSLDSGRSTTPTSIARSATPVDPQSKSYADHLNKLVDEERYAEIPTLFEAMLATNVQPVASAYNALLAAAIHIPKERVQVVSKTLDVYADMARRKVPPDSDTYNILVGLLASNCLEVTSMKKTLEAKRVRYGGMDEAGKFMFASNEYEYAILSEENRLDLAIKLFETSVMCQRADYSSETYLQLISACAQAGRVRDMLRLFDHMWVSGTVPFAAVFPPMIGAFAHAGDLASAVECYNEYKELAVAQDGGKYTLSNRLDAQVYAAVVEAYIVNGKLSGAVKFLDKIVAEYGVRAGEVGDVVIGCGFVKGLSKRGGYQEALQWARRIKFKTRGTALADVATESADAGNKSVAVAAFASVPRGLQITPAMALLAMSVRGGDVPAATTYWQVLSNPQTEATPEFIEPTAMYAAALIGSGLVVEGLTQSQLMFGRIRAAHPQLVDEVDEGVEFINNFMLARGIVDPRQAMVPAAGLASPVSMYNDAFDPYGHNTDLKGSSIISDELEGAHGREGPRFREALARVRTMRRAGRHPRYITYAKMIAAAARHGKMDTCHDILAMARTDVPLLPQYPAVRYGWTSILDAMVGACVTLGDRTLAEQYHMELLGMGAAPSANTFGLYITTLKESSKVIDEATEAVKIFHRAKAEGVEPSSFLYNVLIGKLAKARRIDDTLFYFAEMRALGITPTSVTYGTIVNALCRVSDEKLAEEFFDEMEAMDNYKPRAAPYNCIMQFFLVTKRDKAKVLAYYERMKAMGIAPTSHTYKLLVDMHATLPPINMTAAEAVLDMIRAAGQRPDAVHYSSLIHARGCVLKDLPGACKIFDSVLKDASITTTPYLFQALFEAMVANNRTEDIDAVLEEMRRRRVELTPYIANTLIRGWAKEKDIARAQAIYSELSRDRREPSTYDAMTRAFLSVGQLDKAKAVVQEMQARGFPNAVVTKVLELFGASAGAA